MQAFLLCLGLFARLWLQYVSWCISWYSSAAVTMVKALLLVFQCTLTKESEGKVRIHHSNYSTVTAYSRIDFSSVVTNMYSAG